MALGKCAIVPLISSLLLAAAPIERPLTADETLVIKRSVEAKLLDPASAQFRLSPYRSGTNYYCGLVNARNRFGGYAGFRPFLARVGDDKKGPRAEESITSVAAVVLAHGDGETTALWAQVVEETCAKNGYATPH